MRMVVLDARGLIGSKVVNALRQRRHEVVDASAELGVNTVTGQGLAEALTEAQVVIDVVDQSSWRDAPALELTAKCCLNIVCAASLARVRHYVALSEVGADRLLDSAHFRTQRIRENLIEDSLVPHTILRATQFFEYIARIDRFAVDGQAIRVAPTCVQPVLSDEVAAALVDLAVSFPRNSTLEMAGPERLRLDATVRRLFSVTHSARQVVTDTHAHYFGVEVGDDDLMPDDEAIIGVTRFEEWLRHSTPFRVSLEE